MEKVSKERCWRRTSRSPIETERIVRDEDEIPKNKLEYRNFMEVYGS